METGQPSSPSSMVSNATMPSVPPPLPPPSLVQEGSPAKVSRAPPPPPPGNISAALRAKKAACKLRRSTQMGTLYRHLRDRVEGSGCTHGGKAQAKNKTPGGHKSNAGLGMADALAEMTKRCWQGSKDSFQEARFLEDGGRALLQADGVVSKLKGWKLAAPVSKQLDRLEAYFNKIKDDVDMIERNKDEEAKRFQSHSIHFDFGLLVRIKECMVDLSSNCMELALKESEDAKETASVRSAGAPQVAGAPSRTLWRVFQLAFRVYNFAGGQDERADRLTAILAREIEAHPL
ncbi:hypothetical protein HU200_002607 [Digitaria exilis]|uniref:Hydroxyproline-rich glycoprotein family protein n=1 Tax=Digitaria exilis TaxID=1010633 RepID=A0A835FY45_9POAL|nr:hypothetical protein HU200_002607 [Digitaria exilis]